MGVTVNYVFTCDATQYAGAHAGDTGLATGGQLPAGWVSVTDTAHGGKTYRFHDAAEAEAFAAGTAGASLTDSLPVAVEYDWACDYEQGHMENPTGTDTTTTTPDLPDGWVRVVMPNGTTEIFHSSAHGAAAIADLP